MSARTERAEGNGTQVGPELGAESGVQEIIGRHSSGPFEEDAWHPGPVPSSVENEVEELVGSGAGVSGGETVRVTSRTERRRVLRELRNSVRRRESERWRTGPFYVISLGRDCVVTRRVKEVERLLSDERAGLRIVDDFELAMREVAEWRQSTRGDRQLGLNEPEDQMEHMLRWRAESLEEQRCRGQWDELVRSGSAEDSDQSELEEQDSWEAGLELDRAIRRRGPASCLPCPHLFQVDRHRSVSCGGQCVGHNGHTEYPSFCRHYWTHRVPIGTETRTPYERYHVWNRSVALVNVLPATRRTGIRGISDCEVRGPLQLWVVTPRCRPCPHLLGYGHSGHPATQCGQPCTVDHEEELEVLEGGLCLCRHETRA